MTAATFRGSPPAAAPVTSKPVVRKKGFFARVFDAVIEARQREVEEKIARYTREGRLPPRFYL